MNPAPDIANRETVLVVFCRRPAPGVGKQRLAAGVGREAALSIADALLACTLEDLRDWNGPIVLAPAEPQDQVWAQSLLGTRTQVQVQPQQPGNLGERLEAVDRVLRAQGATRVLYIGTDAPALPSGCFVEAADALCRADVVVVPARDGGVALMGAARAWPPLAALPWSTAALGASLEAACRARGDSIARLAGSSDVDELADLDWVCTALADDRRPARRELWRLADRARRTARREGVVA